MLYELTDEQVTWLKAMSQGQVDLFNACAQGYTQSESGRLADRARGLVTALERPESRGDIWNAGYSKGYVDGTDTT